jgi:hypothetical protein
MPAGLARDLFWGAVAPPETLKRQALQADRQVIPEASSAYVRMCPLPQAPCSVQLQ